MRVAASAAILATVQRVDYENPFVSVQIVEERDCAVGAPRRRSMSLPGEGCERRMGAGTSGNDTLQRTDRDELFLALDGKDSVLARGGRDCLFGGAGADLLRAGAAGDLVADDP